MALRVNGSSKLSIALSLHPDILEYIVSLKPHDFSRLRNPLMRRLMPPRISLARIAMIASLPLNELLKRIHEIAGISIDPNELIGDIDEPLPTNPQKPDWIDGKIGETVDLLEGDARLDIDPLPPISRAIKRAAPGEIVLVKHMWEPQPLYDIWKKIKVDWYSEKQTDTEWWIYIKKQAKT